MNNPEHKKDGEANYVSNNQTPRDRRDLSSFSDLILFNGIMLFMKDDKGKSQTKETDPVSESGFRN